MPFTGPLMPPRCSVRDVMTTWMATSTIGPPRLCSITATAEAGPIRSTPTLAINDSPSGTLIMPRPIAPKTIGSTRFGKYGTPPLSVEP